MSQYLVIGVGGLVMLGLKFGEVLLRFVARRLGVDPTPTQPPTGEVPVT